MLDKIVQFFVAVGEFYQKSKFLQGLVTAFNIATVVVGVKGYLQARNMLSKGQDILLNKTSAGGKIPAIYGTRRVGAQIVYMDVSSNDSRDLYVVYALSVGECDEIIGRTIELDGNPLTDSARFRDGGYIGSDRNGQSGYSNHRPLNRVSQNGTGINAGAGQFGTSPTSRYRYVFNLHHGAATQTADPMLVASMPNWTTAHKLNGVAYICAHYGYDKEGIWKGIPQLTVQVKGRRVYDPRESGQTFGNPSTYAYSNNPALCFLDFITDDQIGKGIPQSEINMSTFSAAATLADYEVEQPFFNGSAKSLTWSGNSGDDFITINGTSADNNWWQSKITEIIDIYDANGNGVITGGEIKDAQRDQFYDSSAGYAVYIDKILDSDYTNENGSYLIKSKRFHCNGVVNTNNNVMDNAKELLAGMRGIFLYINGNYELKIEDSGSPTFNITEDHIIGDSGISIDYGKKDARANKVVVEFFNANKKYELDTATVLHTASVSGEDYTYDDGGEELEIKAEFAFCTDPYIANNMAKAILTRSRNQLTMAFIGSPTMYLLNVGDIVSLTYAGLGFSGKQCVVEALELQPNGLVSVNLIEYFDVYTWEVPPQEPLEQIANLPSAYAVKPPTGLAFTDTDASDTGRPFLSWNEPTDFPVDQYRVNVVDDTGNQYLNKIVDVTRCELNFTPTGNNYVATVTSLNSLGVESSALSHTFNVVDMPAGTPDIKDDAITNQKLGDGSVTNVKVLNLSAGKIDTGELNLGQESGMAVRQTKTGYSSTATGFWLGNDGGTPKFNIGTSTNYLKFDGTNLNILGSISATTGAIGGFQIGTTSIIDNADSFGLSSAVTAGDDVRFFAGNTLANKNIAPFRITEAGNLTALSATITGALTLTNVDGTTVTYSGGNLGVADSGISTSKLLAHATSIINPVSATGNVYRYGGYNDIGTVVNTIPSAITLSYNSSENALSLVSDGNTSIRSDSFEIDHNSIYKLSLQIKKTTTGGNWYVGATQFTSFTSGSSSDGGNSQTSNNFGVYSTSRVAGADANNVYFAVRSVADTNYSEIVVYLIGSNVNIDEVPNHSYSTGVGGLPYVRLASSSTHAGIRILNWGNGSTTRTLLVKNITMAKMTANTIVAENISTTNLAAINSDLGNITAGSLNIGSGNFTVSTAGLMTATGASINGTFVAGSGTNIFTADTNGIYTGNSSFASAPFKVNASGSVQTTNSFTAGITGTSDIAVISGSDATYRFWSGNQSPTSANFSVDKTGKVVAQHLVLKLLDGTVFFDSSTGFTSSALSQISTTTGTKVSTISSTFDADTEFESVTVTEQTTVNVSVSLNTLFGGSGSSNQNEATSESNSEADIPDNFTLVIQHSSDGGANYSNLKTQQFTKVNTGTPTANQYKITTNTTRLFISGQGGIAFESNSSTDIGTGCVDSTGNTVLTHTGLVLTVSGVSTTHRIKATVSTTDSSYDTINKVTSTAPRVLQTTDPSGDGFYVSDGDGTQVAPSGDITRVQITTDASSGLTGGQNFLSGDALFNLALASTIPGNKTFSNNVIIENNLTVNGTTTSVNTDDLNVKDKNITLNYSTGNSSASANGAGITIQDAVSAGNDATLTWNTANDSFNFSHNLNFADNLRASFGAGNDLEIYHQSSNNNSIIKESGGGNLSLQTNGSEISFYDTANNANLGRFITGGAVKLFYSGNAKFETTSTGIDVTGSVTADGLTVDGGSSSLTHLFTGARAGTLVSIDNESTSTSYGLLTNTASVSANSYPLWVTSNDVNRLTVGGNGDISFYEDTGTTAKFFWDSSAESLGIGTTVPDAKLRIDQDANSVALKVTGGGSGVNIAEFSRDVGSTASVNINASGGEPQIVFVDANTFSIGVNSNTFEIADNAAIGTNTRFAIDNAGAITIGGSLDTGAITSSGNLHAGDGTNISMDSSANGQLEVDGNAYQGAIALDSSAMHIYHNSSVRGLVLGTNETARLTIAGTGGFNFESNSVQGITTLVSGDITIANTTTPVLTLSDTGNAGGGGASGKVIFKNTGGDAMGIGYTSNVVTDSDMIISTNAGGTYGGYLGLDASAITDTQADIILEPKTNVRIATGSIEMGTTAFIDQNRNLTVGTISSGALDVTGVITTDGMTTSADINFGDNDKALFGASNNLQIYSDGTNAFIKESGSGHLYIQATNLRFKSLAGENFMALNENGAVTSYYDNSVKLATTSTGIDVTGGITTSSDITLNGGHDIHLVKTHPNNGVDMVYGQITFGDTTASQYVNHARIESGGGYANNSDLRFHTSSNNSSPVRFQMTNIGEFKVGTITILDQSRNLTNVTSYNGYTPTASSSSTNSVISLDSRNANTAPTGRNKGLYVDFKTQSVIGLTGIGTYAGVLTFRSYGSNTDLSGGQPIQIAYDQAGNLQTRYGATSSWGSWKAIHTAGSNLTAGTINSGAITSSASSTIQGNLLLDSASAEINLKSGIGTESGSINWTFNTTGTNFASIKLPYDTRATKGLWIDSGYPITIDATTNIRFDISGVNKGILNNNGLSITGTIGSGAITSSGASSFTDLAIGGAADSNYDLKVYGLARFQGTANFVSSGNAIQIGGITLVDASRNITAATINATALVSDSGNNFSQIKLSGNNGTNGDSYRFTLNNDNKLLLQRSTDNFAANATLALTIDSSQNAIFSGSINAGAITTTSDIFIPVGNKLYFGGANHTYISEDINDRMRFFTGGAEFMRFTEDTTDQVNIYANTIFSGSITSGGTIFFNTELRASNVSNKLILNASSTTTEIHSAGTGGIVFKSNGNVPVGTLSTSGQLSVNSTISGGAITSSSNIVTTNSSAVIQTPRISMEADGTLDWGSAKNYGTLTWDTNKAIVVAQSGSSLEFKTNNNGLALTLDTSQNANFAGTISTNGKLTISNSAYNNHLRIVRSGQGDLNLSPSGNQLLLGGGGFSPASNNAFDLGRTDKYWQDLWLGSTLKMAGATILDAAKQLQNITGLGASTTNTATGSGVGFKFVATDTVVDQAFNGFTIDHNVSGSDTATADRTHVGLNVDQDSSATGGDTSNEHRIYGIQVSSKATGDSDLIRGINSLAISDHDTGTVTNVQGINSLGKASGEGQTTLLYGIIGNAQKTGGGATPTIYGSFGKSHILSTNTGTVTTAHGVFAEVELDSNTTLTNAYGVRSVIDRDNGTITNGFLYHGDYQGTLPTNAWGVYIADDVPNYFTGSVSGKSFIKAGGTDGQFLKADGSVQESTASSPQGTTSPFDATNNTLTFLLNVSHLDGLVTGSQTGVLDLSTGELEINSQGELNIKAESIEASKIAADTITATQIAADTITATEIAASTITGTQINTDLLNVKSFDNVSSTIKSHITAGTKFPLAREGQTYVQRSGTYTGSNASFVPVTITQVRDNAGYVAIFSGVLGNVSGGRVQYSLNNFNWINANGNTNIYWNAGTYRGYTYVYTGQITTLSAAQSTVYWRVYFSGSYNHTQLSLNVMMDNTR